MKKVYMFGLMIALVVVAGCTNNEATIIENDGIVITDFGANLNDIIESDKYFDLYLDIENWGGTTAEEVKVEILGVNWVIGTVGDHFDKLSPPDITVDPATPGQSKATEWRIPTPDLPEGVVQTYPLTARVRYYYSTSALSNIKVMQRDEYRRKSNRGEIVQEPTLVTNSNAPIKVSIETANPILVDEFIDEPFKEVTIKLNFDNYGSGMPLTASSPHNNVDGLIGGMIWVDGPGVFFIDCLGYGCRNGNCLNYDGDAFILDKEIVKLRRGQSLSKTCTIGLDKAQWSGIPEGTITLGFDLRYDYYTESKINLRVTGERGKKNGNEFYTYKSIRKILPLFPSFPLYPSYWKVLTSRNFINY